MIRPHVQVVDDSALRRPLHRDRLLRSTAADAPDADAATAAATAAPATLPARRPLPRGAQSEASTTRHAWLDIELTDADHAARRSRSPASQGQVVAIEPMAIWCSSCKTQQDNVKRAYADIEAEAFATSVSGWTPTRTPIRSADYAERAGYEWTFARRPTEFVTGPQRPLRRPDPVAALDAADRPRCRR